MRDHSPPLSTYATCSSSATRWRGCRRQRLAAGAKRPTSRDLHVGSSPALRHPGDSPWQKSTFRRRGRHSTPPRTVTAQACEVPILCSAPPVPPSDQDLQGWPGVTPCATTEVAFYEIKEVGKRSLSSLYSIAQAINQSKLTEANQSDLLRTNILKPFQISWSTASATVSRILGRAWTAGRLPPTVVWLTFDDGSKASHTTRSL